ncbi:MAG: CGNR zinc finger domain-containing protein [Acidimicrobiia bacterium]|nr:CGNR zinc finger domain-containing protein [Acidimicrobiia bacterium]
MSRSHSDIPVTPSNVACIDLVNSRFTDYLGSGDNTDRIASSQWQEWFLQRYALKPQTRGPIPLDELVALRRDLRRILDKWSAHGRLSPRDVSLLDARVQATAVRHRVRGRGTGLKLVQEPLRRDWEWVIAEVSASAVELMGTGDPRRLKSCGNPACSWVFYDTSVNHSRRYCAPTPCGSLMRVRRFRSR